MPVATEESPVLVELECKGVCITAFHPPSEVEAICEKSTLPAKLVDSNGDWEWYDWDEAGGQEVSISLKFTIA